VVRKWDWTGSVTALLKGHTDYVYQVAIGAGDEGKVLSCGEDHTAVYPSFSDQLHQADLIENLGW
jgi:hypothetical protein